MISFNPHHSHIISPILQMRAPRLKEVKSCIQGHRTSGGTGQGLDPGNLMPAFASVQYAIVLTKWSQKGLVSTPKDWGEQEELVLQ